MRTTIAWGDFEYQKRYPLINFGKNMLWGGAYLAAYLANDKVKLGSIVLLCDPENWSNSAVTSEEWRWLTLRTTKVKGLEYFWSACCESDVEDIQAAQRLRKKQERIISLKDLFEQHSNSRPF